MVSGVYNHLRNERYLGSITILSFGDWIPRVYVSSLFYQVENSFSFSQMLFWENHSWAKGSHVGRL